MAKKVNSAAVYIKRIVMKKVFFISSFLLLSLTGCDVFESSKNTIEQEYLSQNSDLKQIIKDIREQGLSAYKTTTQQGSMAACVAKQLDADPMGALIEVEGVLKDSADLSTLAKTIESLPDQSLSLDSIPNLLQQGADTVNYLRTLLSEYDLSELQEKIGQSIDSGQSQDIGAHLRGLVEQCQ
jgi:hypothetical protein